MAAVHKQTIKLLEQLHRRVSALEMNTTRLTAPHGESAPVRFEPNPQYDLLEQLESLYGSIAYIVGNSVHIYQGECPYPERNKEYDALKVILSVEDDKPGIVHVWIAKLLSDKHEGMKKVVAYNNYVTYADLVMVITTMTDGNICPV